MFKQKKTILLVHLILLTYGCERAPFDLDLFDEAFPLAYKKMSKNAVIEIISAPAVCFFGDVDAAKFSSRLKKRRKFQLNVNQLGSSKNIYQADIRVKTKKISELIMFNSLQDGIYGLFLCDKKGNSTCSLSSHSLHDLNDIIKVSLFAKSKERTLLRKDLLYSGNIFLKLGDYVVAAKASPAPGILFDAYIKLLKTYKGRLPNVKKALSEVRKIHTVLRPSPLLGPGRANFANKQRSDDLKVYFQIPELSREKCHPKELKKLYAR